MNSARTIPAAPAGIADGKNVSCAPALRHRTSAFVRIATAPPALTRSMKQGRTLTLPTVGGADFFPLVCEGRGCAEHKPRRSLEFELLVPDPDLLGDCVGLLLDGLTFALGLSAEIVGGDGQRSGADRDGPGGEWCPPSYEAVEAGGDEEDHGRRMSRVRYRWPSSYPLRRASPVAFTCRNIPTLAGRDDQVIFCAPIEGEADNLRAFLARPDSQFGAP
jgi:hypothetical protein